MLWYKTWLETRTRFVVALAGMLVICFYSVFHGDGLAEPDTKLDYYYGVLYAAQQLMILMWILAVTLLNMDGLLREKLVGSSSFTLALPASRACLMYARISVTFLEAMALVIAPSVTIFLVGSVFGRTHSIYQAVFQMVLVVGGGLVFFASAVLCSALIEGQYSAPMVSFGISIALVVSSRHFSPFACMIGEEQFDRQSGLLVGPIPWLRLVAFAFFSVVLIAAAIQLVRKRDF